MSLEKQVFIYSVDTSAFYNQNEMKIHRKLNNTYRFRKLLNNIKSKLNDQNKEVKINNRIARANKRIKFLKNRMYDTFKNNTEIRNLNDNHINDRNIVSVFESVLTRTLNITTNTISTDIFIVQTYFFDIIEDIIQNGFLYQGERYICFTASAGQIRTKKTIFIKEKVFISNQNTLMCGLSIDHINKFGGVNINKYLAYLALCNTATDQWNEFDINRAIVVNDFETTINSLVDFIDDQSYEIKRQQMDMVINHTDGCGMVLPSKRKKSVMIRSPWIKGLLVPFPYDKFIREQNKLNPSIKCGVVTDIYGKKYDLIKDKIEVIFTKSQFKMWKYYSSWDEYKEFYTKYKCQTGICNEEETHFRNAKMNYQMLQTLTDMTDEELIAICEYTKKDIIRIGSDKEVMLRVLGVTESNHNKNYFQSALEIYPELLSDTYSKEILKQVKKSMVNEARSGKIDITGKYTFICPDLYAFCEYLILGINKPKGLLRNHEVYCALFKHDPRLDCLRSPHLYREHAIRNNRVDKENSRWFITKGLYTSCHDDISKILMFDVDGDKSLVCSDKTLIKVAERNMKDIVPLYYNMTKSAAEEINNENIFNSLKAAYTGGNIGVISNDITKIWNSDHVDLDTIKILCMENNFTIDYAKTLYKPERPKDIKTQISKFTKNKAPHFFIYAKNKIKNEVEKINRSVVNRLENLIPNPRLNFKASNLGKLDHKLLMSRYDVELDKTIIEKYTELDVNSHFMINSNDEKYNNISYVYLKIHENLLTINNNPAYVVDVLVKYLYEHKKTKYKTTLWECFGDQIIENIKNNLSTNFIDGFIQCQACGERIPITSNRKKYCPTCLKNIRNQQNKEKALRYYYKNKK